MLAHTLLLDAILACRSTCTLDLPLLQAIGEEVVGLIRLQGCLTLQTPVMPLQSYAHAPYSLGRAGLQKLDLSQTIFPDQVLLGQLASLSRLTALHIGRFRTGMATAS